MKNILLILVGGTICTELNEEGNLSVSKRAGALLTAHFENSDSPYAKKVQIEQSENLYILSENMTVERWNRMLDTYREHTAEKAYDGIIFAHGTDTLAYSAALFAQLLSNTDVPVFFVSANERLDSPRSNGNANFRCAVEWICEGIAPNVYAVYRNLSNGKMYLHLASRLCQCPNYSEDFHSVGMLEVSEENRQEVFEKIKALYPADRRVAVKGRGRLKPCVLMLEPYVGIDYSAFDYQKYAAVLHGTYHSGTACADGEAGVYSVGYLADRCAELGVDAYLSPALLKAGTYETVPALAETGISFLYGYTKETAYAKLLIAYSMMDADERAEYLEKECNFENIG